MICLPLLISSFSHATNVAALKGLSLVIDIHQDDDNYLWLATQQGLTRFDGEDTIHFSSFSSQWRAPFSWVKNIEPHNDSLLLTSEVNGLFLFDLKTATSTKLELPKEMINPQHAIAFKGQVYFKDRNNLYRFDLQSRSTHLIKEGFNVFSIKRTDNAVYVVTDSGIYQIKRNTLAITYPHEVDAYTTSGSYLIFSKGNELFSVDDSNVIAKRASSPISAFTPARNGPANVNEIIGVTSSGEVSRFNAKDLSVVSNAYENIGKHSINIIFHDNSGVLWVSSNQGINRYYEKPLENHRYIFDIENNDNELLMVNNELLVGSFGNGLRTLKAQPWFNPSMNASLTPRAKYTMKMVRHKDSIIFGTLDGVWQYKLGAKKAYRMPFARNNNIVLSLKNDGTHLYIGTNHKGVKIYNWQQQKLVQTINKQHGLQNLEVLDILPQASGDTWLTTANSVEIFRKETKQVQQTGITSNKKFIALASANNKVYAFSKGNGIHVFNLQGELLSVFGKNIDFGYITKVDDEIWASSKSGLYRVSTSKNELSLVLGSEGFKFNSAPAVTKNAIYAWHAMGYVKVNYRNTPYYNAKIKITRTNISGNEQLNNRIISLNSTKDVVSLYLASLDFRSNANKHFKYRINDNVWVDVTGNQLTLAGLSSGNYTIEVMGTNSLGQWSNYIEYTNINVAFPWYWTPQIRVIYLVLVICFVSLSLWLIYLRTKSISSVYKVLDDDLKTRGLLANNIERNINVSLRLLKEGEHDKAVKLLSESASLIATNQMNAEPSTLHNHSLSGGIDYLVDYWLEHYSVRVVTNIDYDVDQLSQKLQQSIYRIIYAAIDSAISHSRSVSFSVSIKPFNQKLWLTIEDSNDYFTGFDSKVNFNIAMYTIRKIALKHNATINAYKTQSDHSQLTLSFNIDEHFENNI